MLVFSQSEYYIFFDYKMFTKILTDNFLFGKLLPGNVLTESSLKCGSVRS